MLNRIVLLAFLILFLTACGEKICKKKYDKEQQQCMCKDIDLTSQLE